LIWIIGEYAEKIDNAEELLGIFVDSFNEDAYLVRAFLRIFIVKGRVLMNMGLGAIANHHCGG
jgi:hypothetical protein